MMRRLPWVALGVAAAGAGLYGLWQARSSGRGDRLSAVSGPRIVILGGGFAGTSAARELRRRLGNNARITLVDRHNYHLFTPMLYEVAAWGLDPYDIAMPLRDLASPARVVFRQAVVRGVDFDARHVQLDNGQLDYDYLLLALGTTTNFFGNQDAVQYTYPIKWLEDGVAISGQIIERLERATITADQEERRALLTFVIVGGGATGVETAASLQDMLQHVLGDQYPNLNLSESRVIVVEMLDQVLANMPARIGEIALRRLRQMGIDVWLQAKAKEVSPDHLTLEDGRTVPTHTVLWTAGVRAPDVVAKLDAPHGKGGSIKVDQRLRVMGRPGVYAAGDNALFEDPKTHQSVPLLAQAAIQVGEAAARNIARQIQGQPQEPFHYRSLGNAIALGRWHGIVQTGNVTLDGLVGWASWRFIHLVRMDNLRDKLATILDWSIGYFYTLDTTRLDLRPAMPDATQAVQQA